jgi:hypothetical protein
MKCYIAIVFILFIISVDNFRVLSKSKHKVSSNEKSAFKGKSAKDGPISWEMLTDPKTLASLIQDQQKPAPQASVAKAVPVQTIQIPLQPLPTVLSIPTVISSNITIPQMNTIPVTVLNTTPGDENHKSQPLPTVLSIPTVTSSNITIPHMSTIPVTVLNTTPGDENHKSQTFRTVGPFDNSTINTSGQKYSQLFNNNTPRNINSGFYGGSRLTR